MSKLIDPFSEAMGEALDPSEIDVFGPLEYVPTAKQQKFHKLSREKVNAILYGGAAGGGKSAALTMEAVHNAVNFPGMRIACIRRTYNELNESFLAEVAKRGWIGAFGARWNATDHILRFPNGSIINFTYAENEKDASRLLGGEYQMFCIDEASLMAPSVIQRIEERLRSGRRDLPVIGMRMATNPGGVSHTYLRKRFINPTNHGKIIYIDDEERTIAFIPAKVDDNPHVDKGYIKVLNAIPDPQRRAAMRDGDWDAAPGQFFEQWRRDRHVIEDINPFLPIPKEWQRYCGIDWGWRDEWAVVWAACDNDGRLWVYREEYASFVDTADQAKIIVEAEVHANEEFVIRVADPSMWGNRGTEMSIAATYALNGCGIEQAQNDRLTGWARVHDYLNEGPPCEYHRELGRKLEDEGKDNVWVTCPNLHVFGDECPNFVDTIPALPRSETNPDDAVTKLVADHIPDALRYLCMSVGTNARPVFYDDQPTPSQKDNRELQEAENAARQQVLREYGGEVPSMVGGIFASNRGLGMTF